MDNREVLAALIEKRGIQGEEEIAEFLSFHPKKTYDPFLLKNMEAGVDLLLECVKHGKKICIYGDYDSDGIASISLLHGMLNSLVEGDVSYYIPSRFDEGYGLNKKALDILKSQGVELIITVDCGSNSCEEVAYAQSIGMEIIVTDHHRIQDRGADCILINPKQEDCSYPFKDLAGCGVAFKFVQALVVKGKLARKVLAESLDLVALGTIGDVVPLRHENRTLVKYGIRCINEKKRMGLRNLLNRIQPPDKPVNSETLSYQVVPHINAAGRIAIGDIGVNLLVSTQEEESTKYVELLTSYNKQRKVMQNEAYKKCLKEVEEHWADSPFPIVEADQRYEGIAGVVSGKLKEHLKRPVVVVTYGEEGYKGSGRSVDGVDLFALLKKYEHLFIRFGGHKGACGFLISKENLDELRNSINDDMVKLIREAPEVLKEVISADMDLPADLLTISLAKAIEEMEPFGSENPRPVFRLKDVRLSHRKAIGNGGEHGRFIAHFVGGKSISCVLFHKMKEFSSMVNSNDQLILIGTLSVNTWQGKDNLQFMVDQMCYEEQSYEH